MRVLLSKVLLEDKWYRWFLFSLVLAGGISFLLMFYLFWVGAFEGLLPAGIVIPGRDFMAQYNVAILFSQGEDLWATSNHYFPLLVFYHLLFSHLSFYPAFLAITLWNLLLALIASVLATRILGYYHISLPPAGKWLIFLAIIFFCPITASLNSGNVNTLVFCFVAPCCPKKSVVVFYMTYQSQILRNMEYTARVGVVPLFFHSITPLVPWKYL